MYSSMALLSEPEREYSCPFGGINPERSLMVQSYGQYEVKEADQVLLNIPIRSRKASGSRDGFRNSGEGS